MELVYSAVDVLVLVALLFIILFILYGIGSGAFPGGGHQ